MYILVITLYILTAIALAAPKHRTRTPDGYDNLPWKLSNIVILESHEDSSNPTFVKFDLEDPNPGLEITTMCARAVSGGSDLVSEVHFPCNEKSMGFSYRGNEIWIHHSWRDNNTK